jgi:acetolactate synthase-1/2/3 large subunit
MLNHRKAWLGNEMRTVADYLVHNLLEAGVQYLFGMPGGGSNLDIIEAAHKQGLPFVLSHTEVAGAFMASAQAEATGRPGACLATLGPGVASLTNGVANALLERIPLLVLTDCHPAAIRNIMQHQTISHTGLFSPITKASFELGREKVDETLAQALATATRFPPGPVHLDCSSEVAKAVFEEAAGAEKLAPGTGQALSGQIDTRETNLAALQSSEIKDILSQARRPVVLVGLGARSARSSAAVRKLCQRFNLPALVTYKAKGVIADEDPGFAGVLTNGSLEKKILGQSDLFLAVGLDPVELLAKSWDYPQPLIRCSQGVLEQHHLPVRAELVGDIGDTLEEISLFLPEQNEWDNDWLAGQLEAQRNAMRPVGEAGKLWPHRVVELVAQVYPRARGTVDAGAHMFGVMALWPASYPNNLLISNGLASMSFALPGAIGLALLDRTQPTLAFTGDGGLLMGVAELRTAVREKLPLRVIVFDDEALSLIKLKQQQWGYALQGIALEGVNWEQLATGLGATGRKATTEAELWQVLEETFNIKGPVLIDARIDPTPYQAMLNALRG